MKVLGIYGSPRKGGNSDILLDEVLETAAEAGAETERIYCRKMKDLSGCLECGECMLDYTGGICPLTACTKGLINGQCGGSKDGRCEVEPDVRPCGWYLIYERLEKLGRLDKMKAMPPIKDYGKMQPPKQLRSTLMFNIDEKEQKKNEEIKV